MDLKPVRMIAGMRVTVASDWTAEAEERGTTLATSVWSQDGDLVLSDPSIDGAAAFTAVSAPSCGIFVLTNTATMADGSILKSKREIHVESQ